MRTPDTSPPQPSRARRLATRALPIGAVLAVATVGAMYGPDTYKGLEKDWGCDTAEVENGGSALQAAQEAATKLELPQTSEGLMDNVQHATTLAVNEVGSAGTIHPGQEVKLCATSNPADMLSNGWHVEVSIS